MHRSMLMAMTQRTTPKELDFRFPAEWEPQEAVWFAWPVREDLWPGRLDRVRAQLAALYRLAAQYQAVRVLCPAAHQAYLQDLLAAAGGMQGIECHDYQSDDIWIRDFGPIFLLSQDGRELCLADWRFNAWGKKFPQYQRDDRASAWIAQQLGLRRFDCDLVLEGGAVESNGVGQLMTTEAVLLHPNRNGAVTPQRMEAVLCDGLAVDAVLWLQDGLAGDDTDGHIDNLARFFQQDGILIATAAESGSPNHAALQENFRRLERYRTPAGAAFSLTPLPLPSLHAADGEPLAASYLNFLVLNGAVLVPTYRQPELDARALQIIGKCFPGREVVGFDCADIIHEGGALHCMSLNQPRAV